MMGAALVIVLAAVGAGVYVLQNLGGVVKGLIEDVGTETTGTRVKVQDVQLSLTEGSGTVSGLTVANPEGFSKANLFEMDSIGMTIDAGSLTEDVYVINKLTIDGARILAEQVGGGTNIQALMNGMSSDEGEVSAGTDESASEILLAVEEITFINGKIKLQSDVLGAQDLALPDFTLRDIGTRESGLTPDELSEEIASEVLGEVKDAVMASKDRRKSFRGFE
jgi:uncharacterized protein involved in outer membrane biogenesis